ncbi:MAG: hypothetical protein U5P41_04370 [Gammaproteobacteria bacterium]|nr:hypothetical protein [Gammaproteobacteria bacterium]
MKEQLQAYQEKIDALTIRERGMVLLAVVAVMMFVWDIFLMSPLDSRQSQLNSQLKVERAKLSALNVQIRQRIAARNVDPNAANRERLAELQAELAELEEQVQDTATGMIAPARMPEVLRNVINRMRGLTLAQLKGLGVSPLIETAAKEDADSGDVEPAANGEEDADPANAFKHGLQLELRADYLTTLEYLRRLQALEWHFLWDRLEFQVEEYPDAKATLTIYTLSLTRDWIRA